MSGTPSQPPRQRTPPSPSHPPQPPAMAPAQTRPLQRPTQYPRYYRPSAAQSSALPVLGWTPRTPAAPRVPTAPYPHVAPRTSAGAPRQPAANPMHQSPSNTALQSSPRISPSSVPAALPIPIQPAVGGAQTPSWLKGTYRPQPPPTPAPPPISTVEAWCKERLDAIKATVESKSDAVPELRKVMEDLDYCRVAEEMAAISSIRREYWKARERQRKAAIEQRRAEREVQRIDLHAAHIDAKITRLRGYARFIENGWVDEPDTKQENDCANSRKRHDSKSSEDTDSSRPSKVRRTEAALQRSQSMDEIQAS